MLFQVNYHHHYGHHDHPKITTMLITIITHHFILVIHTGALLDQLLHDVHVALGGCPLKSRVPRLSIIMRIIDDDGYGDDGGDDE